jgi:hypothetical protein
MKLAQLQQNPNNPRQIKKKAVEKLTTKIIKGYTLPEYKKIAYDSANGNVILAGNQRHQVFSLISEMSEEELRAIVNTTLEEKSDQDAAFTIFDKIRKTKAIPKKWVYDAATLSQEQKDQLVIVDNVHDGDWDTDILANVWQDSDALQWVDIKLPNVDVDFSKKNEEIDIDSFENNVSIVLNYTLEEYEIVREELFKYGNTPEQAIWNLLKLGDEK